MLLKKGSRAWVPGPWALAQVILEWVSKSSPGLQIQPGTPNLAWDYKSSLGLQIKPGPTNHAREYKTSARKEDKHPTLNTVPARSVIKKGVPGLGPWARSRTGPGPACMSYLHGSTRLAMVYKSSVEEERRKRKEERRNRKEKGERRKEKGERRKKKEERRKN